MLELIALDVALVETCFRNTDCTSMDPLVIELVQDFYRDEVGIDLTFHKMQDERLTPIADIVLTEETLASYNRNFNKDGIELTLRHTNYVGYSEWSRDLGRAWENYSVTLVKPLPNHDVVDKAHIVAHELGHLLGLGHVALEDNLMYSTYEAGQHGMCCSCGACTKENVELSDTFDNILAEKQIVRARKKAESLNADTKKPASPRKQKR